jgi:crotonobetainyl-CoA:carnitine CoA-transferase CaiB-like acyl-CoA transferase
MVQIVPGVPIVDQHGAALLALAISAAFARKITTGQGAHIESNLLNAGLDLQAESMAAYYSGRRETSRFTRDPRLACWFLPSPYGVFHLADCHAVISLGGDIDTFADVIGNQQLAELAGDRMTNRDAFMRILGDELKHWSFVDLDRKLAPHGFWYAKVQDYDAVRRDPQAIHNGCFQEIRLGDQTATVLAHPIRYDGEVPAVRRMPTVLGGDTRSILQEAGWSVDAIGSLINDGVINAG